MNSYLNVDLEINSDYDNKHLIYILTQLNK